jgi:type VI secretion system secreted protein Hcp
VSGTIIFKAEKGDLAGESTLENQEGWISLSSYSHSIQLPLTIDQKQNKRTSGTASASQFNFTKLMDKTSTQFAQACASATDLGKVTIKLLQESGPVKLELMTYELENCLVASYSVGGGGGVPTENIAISYTKITANYKVQKADATQEGQKGFVFEVAKGKSEAAAGGG